MLMTRASEYALLSLIVIAKRSDPVDSDTLSKQLDISKSFLAKVLQSLARAGVLNSFKGVNGGFCLAKKGSEISVLEIITAVENKTPAVFDCAPSKENCPSDMASVCSIWPFINKLQGKIDDFLASLTLEEILEA